MHLDVVTPKGRLFEGEVEELTAPGVLGEFGVMPGHVPFLTGIVPGVLRYRTKAGEGVIALGPGFAEVTTGDRILLLAEQAESPEKIDVAAARKERDELQYKLDHYDPGEESPEQATAARAALSARKAWAEARLDAVGATSLQPAAH